MEKKLIEIKRIPGLLNADMMKIFLESKGIDAMVVQESAGKAMGILLDGLGHARVYVPEDQVAEAEEILAALERGE
ncbi:hypothetical protein EG834_21570, partial [bacterium]|nr:hypothetical protein [bacterium]